MRSSLAMLLVLGLALAAHLPAAPFDPARLTAELTAIMRNPTGWEAKTAKGAAGLRHMLEGRAQTYPIPLWLYKRTLGDKKLTELWLQDGVIGNPFVGSDEITPGMGDAVASDELGVRTVSKTCLLCHAGTVAGQLVAGLPNRDLDMVPQVARLAKRLAAFGKIETAVTIGNHLPTIDLVQKLSPKKLARTIEYMRDFQFYAANAFLPPLMQSKSRGDNFGPYNVWYMGSKLADPATQGILLRQKPTAETKPLEDLVRGTRLATIEPMPWWEIKFKRRAYWFWDAPFHNPAAFNLNFWTPHRRINSPATFEAHKQKLEQKVHTIDEVLQFARETEPPAMPAAETARLARAWAQVLEGKRIYDGGTNSTGQAQTCASCHGTYTFEADRVVVDYPNTGLEDVGTDPAYNAILQSMQPVAHRMNQTRPVYGPKYAPATYVVSKPGYTSPTLVGVWASAPYLHNGSIPTLQDLLEPAGRRPRLWGRRILEPRAWDFDAVGVPHDDLEPEAFDALVRAARGRDPADPAQISMRRVYDTRDFGRGNQGHEYGVDLAAGEKAALIDFMKALAPTPERPGLVPKEAVPTWAEGAYDPTDPDSPRPE